MNYTIAIADDEEMMRKGLTTMIPWREWGYEVVVTASSGRALIDALEKEIVRICTEKPYTAEACITKAGEFNENGRYTEYIKLYERINTARTEGNRA